MSEKITDIIVVGAGTAGLTAAIYGTRAGYSVTVFEKAFYGGQIVNAGEIENYPAIDMISGYEFAERLYQQSIRLGAEVIFEGVTGLSKTDNNLFEVQTAKSSYLAKAVIIANGAQRRKIECPGEEMFVGRGVSYCATCDGAFYKGRDVAIVGGGNTALDEALYLANYCSKVHLIHRRDDFRASKTTQDVIRSKENIVLHLNSVVKEIRGETSVSTILVQDSTTNNIEMIPVSGVFVAIGLKPDNAMFENIVQTVGAGYFTTDERCRAQLPGLYVAGDTRSKTLRQLVTASSDGAIAAAEASSYISLLE